MNRHFLFLALFTLVSFWSFGQGYQVQSKYFVYLQTEPAQPFYIKINGQQISANASGYLILPQLKDGDYKLIVGFPQSKTEEQRFDFRIDSKDKGYLIKDYGDEGWGLFDLQTMVVQKAIKGNDNEAVAIKQAPLPKEEPKPETVPADGVSDFTKVLSQAAKDPSLLEKPKPAPVEEKPVEQTPVAVEPSPSAEPPSQQTGASQQVDENIANQAAQNRPTAQSGNGVTIVYDDRNESGQVDPITIFIPAPNGAAAKTEAVKETPPQVVEQKPEPAPATVEEPAAKESNGEAGFTVEEKAPLPQKEEATEPAKEPVKNSNEACKSVAGETDFLQLRRAMASEGNDDEMISEAAKAFKSKCYTTAQIKYLSSMFLSNAGKYNFFAAAYAHISDKENFASLESEIKDAGYKSKFQSLIQ
ncbi:DUF4476 domain-containing protein [Niabella ginsengisoli]|uniref:DUF4476 domain-containing protein n=1 Tax=Niabella ginsengisoli TaxID=522298 RepID=A0ABS9SGG0_9BACT|nr:DUF4476 domain-containing protein [Niabella ginsengisoli]MCH5597435.1 DUF4476 domain-containing protein [Niabella ginsengisoli]